MTDHTPDHEHEEDNPLQGYFDWQVNTLMLAHDLADPLPPNSEDAHHARRHQVEQEVRVLTLALLPEEYKHEQTLAWTPDLMMAITRETLKTASKIAGIV